MKKKLLKHVYAFMIAIYIFTMTGSFAQAAKTDESKAVGLAGGFVGEEQVFSGAAFAIRSLDDTLYVLTGSLSREPEYAVFLSIDKGYCQIKYEEGAEITSSYGISFWKVLEGTEDNSEGEIAFFDCNYAYQNEKAAVYYLYENGGKYNSASSNMVLKGMDENGFFIVDKYPTGNISYPAPILNDDKELIGILAGSKIALPVLDNSGNFQEETIASKKDATENNNKNSEEEKKISNSETEETTKRDSSSKDSFWNDEIITGIVIIAVSIAAAVIGVIAVKRKKAKKNIQTNAEAPIPNYPPINAGPFVSPVDDVGKTESFDEMNTETYPSIEWEQPKDQKFWLVAKGGYMDGRVYPVENGEITIGREASSNIRYPANTAGVSRVHAKLYWQNGTLMLMDCNSTSGTFLKRIGKLMPMNPVALQSGDIFYIGEKANSFEIKN